MVLIKKFEDGLVVRTAENKDRGAVLGISVFDGLDYLEHQYDHYMANPRFHCYLGEVNGRVVGQQQVYVAIQLSLFIAGGNR